MNFKCISGIINTGNKLTINNSCLWFIDISLSSHADISVEHKNGGEVIKFPPGWKGVLFLNHVTIGAITGNLQYRELNIAALAKLQVFIDHSINKNIASNGYKINSPKWFSAETKSNVPLTNKSELEIWLLSQRFNNDDALNKVINLLRSTEYYWLVDFLLSESKNNYKLQDLSQRYGLSPAHFRRLSRKALGNSAKVELCGWRMVKALLELMGEKKNLTRIAMEYGYASLSHFSSNIKNALGISPSVLKNIITGSDKNDKK